MQPKSTQAKLLAAADALLKTASPAKKRTGRPKAPSAEVTAPAEDAPTVPVIALNVASTTAANRGRKVKTPAAPSKLETDEDLSEIEAEFAEEPVVVADATASTEKVKPLRMKISKAKERALMKEFGLDETVLSEEDLAKRRSRLKTLIKRAKPVVI